MGTTEQMVGQNAGQVTAPEQPQKEVWTIERCLRWSTGYLERHGEERPRLAAEWLICAAAHRKRIDLYLNFDQPLSEAELAAVRNGLKRRAAGEPLQYITGETSFRQLDILCEPGVLIPRPETELLVDFVLEHLDHTVFAGGPSAARRERVELPWNAEVAQAREQELAALAAKAQSDDEATEAEEDAAGGVATPDEAAPADTTAGEGDLEASDPEPVAPPVAHVLEVGCGTGCISLSLAAERPGAVRCVATDIEPRAVALAHRNRERAGLADGAVDIRGGDLVSPVLAEEYGTFDVLVSNPPYVPTKVVDTLPREVAAFEPHLALDGGADGLDIFRRLLDVAPALLKPGALFAVELFETATEPAAELCRAAGFTDVRVASDMTGRPRFVLAHCA